MNGHWKLWIPKQQTKKQKIKFDVYLCWWSSTNHIMWAGQFRCNKTWNVGYTWYDVEWNVGLYLKFFKKLPTFHGSRVIFKYNRLIYNALSQDSLMVAVALTLTEKLGLNAHKKMCYKTITFSDFVETLCIILFLMFYLLLFLYSLYTGPS